MITRRNSRAIALQTLFYLDFKGEKKINKCYQYSLGDFFDILEEDGKEFERVEKDDYSYELVKNVLDKKEVLDQIIKKAAPEWPLEKISILEKNILRIGIFELLFAEPEIPAPIAINEAIILAKSFNPKKNADKFISGVMFTVLEASDIDYERSKQQIQKEEEDKYGFVAYYIDNEKIKITLVYNIFGKWNLPKGSINGKFKKQQDAILDIAKRKYNIDGELGEIVGEHKYKAGIVNDINVIKHIQYYLLEIKKPEKVKLDKKIEGLKKIDFFEYKEMKKLEIYDDIFPIIENAMKILKKKK